MKKCKKSMYYRSMIKKITHIIKGWFYSLIGKNYELGEKRIIHCNSCHLHRQLTKSLWICEDCGCVTSKKVLVEDERCPIGLW